MPQYCTAPKTSALARSEYRGLCRIDPLLYFGEGGSLPYPFLKSDYLREQK